MLNTNLESYYLMVSELLNVFSYVIDFIVV